MIIIDSKKSVDLLSVGRENTLPTPLPGVVAAVFLEIGPQEVIAEEEGHPDESPPRTEGDNDEESIKIDDETSDEASTDNSSDKESKNDDVESDMI